jgi:putative transposase
MPEYRRPKISGGVVFLTIVAYERRPHFQSDENVNRLRTALATIKSEMPFEITAAVILPEHMHFIWTFPDEDERLSARVGRMKILFTQSFRGAGALPEDVTLSRLKHRESDIWQRRFIDHYIRDDEDFEKHLNYVHYNPVKHGLVTCPHLWPYSSFHRWVEKNVYPVDWCCSCDGKSVQPPNFDDIANLIGE